MASYSFLPSSLRNTGSMYHSNSRVPTFSSRRSYNPSLLGSRRSYTTGTSVYEDDDWEDDEDAPSMHLDPRRMPAEAAMVAQLRRRQQLQQQQRLVHSSDRFRSSYYPEQSSYYSHPASRLSRPLDHSSSYASTLPSDAYHTRTSMDHRHVRGYERHRHQSPRFSMIPQVSTSSQPYDFCLR
jgi:hypothetical protein